MATFRTVNVDEMAQELMRLGQATGPMAREMVNKGADIIADTWKSVIAEVDHVDKRDMLNSVEADEATQKGGAIVSEGVLLLRWVSMDTSIQFLHTKH